MQIDAVDGITIVNPKILCLACKATRRGDERLYMFGGNRPFMSKFEAKLISFIGREKLSFLKDKFKTKQGRSYICKHCYSVVNKTFDNIRLIQKSVATSVNGCTVQIEKSNTIDLECSDSDQEQYIKACPRNKKLPSVAERRAKKIASLTIVKINYKIPKILIRPLELELENTNGLCQQLYVSSQAVERLKSSKHSPAGSPNLNSLSNPVNSTSEKIHIFPNDTLTDFQNLDFVSQIPSCLVGSNKRISVTKETESNRNIDIQSHNTFPDSESKKILNEANSSAVTSKFSNKSPKSTELSLILGNPLLLVKSSLPIKLVDVKDDNVYICGESGCDWIFTSKFFWENHIRHYHFYGKPHKCSFKDCNKYFATQSKCKQHIRRHTGERPFICEECGKSFRGSQELRHHRGTHTVGKPYQCLKSNCYKSFKYISSLKRHLQFHEGNYPFPCLYPMCTKSFKNKYELKCHNRLHTGERPYKCKESGCGKSFRLPCEYTKHKRAHTGERPFKCTWDGCNAAYITSGGLASHKLSHTNDQHLCCEFCGKTFKHKMSYRTHLKLHTASRTVTSIQDCGRDIPLEKGVHDTRESSERLSIPVNQLKEKNKVRKISKFDSQGSKFCESLLCTEHVYHYQCSIESNLCHSSQNYHYEASTNTCQIKSNDLNQRPYKNSTGKDPQAKPYLFPREKMCNICGLAFHHIQQLHLHLNSYHDESSVLNEQEKGIFVCKMERCGNSFQAADELKIHIESHLANPPYRCHYKSCRQTFLLEKMFTSHLLEHEKCKPHSCAYDGCQEAFSTQLKLLRHSKIHYGSFRCPINGCGTFLKAINGARIHMFRHTGEKPYACSLCGGRFATCAQWIRHKRTHTGEKPFECKACHKKFADGGNLKIHMRTHTGETPYICSKCGRGFVSKTACKSHMKSHTGDHPFICPERNCGKAFKDITSLKSHKNVHAKPCHLCSQCGKIYKFNINKHKCKVEELKEIHPIPKPAQQVFQQPQALLQPQKSSLPQCQQKVQQFPLQNQSQHKQSLQYPSLQPMPVLEYVQLSVDACALAKAVQVSQILNISSVSHSSTTTSHCNIDSTMMATKDGLSSFMSEVSGPSRSDKVFYGSNDNAQMQEVDRHQLLSSPYLNYMILYDRSTQQ